MSVFKEIFQVFWGLKNFRVIEPNPNTKPLPKPSVATTLLHKHAFFNSMFMHSWVALIVVFPLISAYGAYLITKFSGSELIIGRWIKDDGPYFKIKEKNCINFQSFDIVNENIEMWTIFPFFLCLHTCSICLLV